jgi:hypothetical protein
MKLTLLAGLLASSTMMMAADSTGNAPVYEMRVYYSPEGKLENLHNRFRNHTLRLFEKHGIKSVGYFVPEGANPENKLIFFLSYPNREAREASWKAFVSDPDWQKAARESEKDGPIVIGNKVQSIFLKPTDYSPTLKVEKKGGRVFELRTYYTAEGKLPNLHARFRDHTINLFKKHGMDNLIYWTKMPDQKETDSTLIYLLAHKDRAAARASFDAFRQDPDWNKARTESEKNGSLTAPNGVKSEFLVATDYSPLK